MRAALLRLYAKARLKLTALRDAHQQDTAERARLLVVVPLAAILGMSLLASRIYSAFSQVSTTLSTYMR